MVHDIQVYARTITNIEADGNDEVRIDLHDVDIDLLVGEFNPESLLECMEYSDILSYVQNNQEDEDDE